MNKIVILGSSAAFPLPRTKTNQFKDYLDIAGYQRNFKLHDDPLCNSAKSGGKDKRTRACIALIYGKSVILFDAGPDIRHQLRQHRLKPDAVFISHAHPDADYGLRFLPGARVFSEKSGNIQPGKKIEIFGVKVTPFRVPHSHIVPYVGYRVSLKTAAGTKTFVYMTDLASLEGVGRYARNSDILFADGSILKRNLPGHLSITNQLAIYKKWRLKRVIFTHIGHDTLPHGQLLKYARSIYPKTNIAHDGMVIKI